MGVLNSLPQRARIFGKQSENLHTVGFVCIQLCLLSNFYINKVKIYGTLLTIKLYMTIVQGAWKCIATLRLLYIEILTHKNTKKEIITFTITNRELQTKEKPSQ